MEAEMIFWAQLVGITGLGGFIGEYSRACQSNVSIDRLFWSNFFAGSFVSLLIGWGLFHMTQQKVWSFIIAGFMSYQDERQATKFLKNLIQFALKGGVDDDSTRK